MTSADQDRVHAWVRAIANSNPFTQNRVTQPSDLRADVTSINEREFRSITRRIQEVREEGNTAGILLTGAAGVGKSHLLARLFNWSIEANSATVIYLHNVLASPERMPRYLLRALVSTLAGTRPGDYPQSTLYQIINRAIQVELAGGGLPKPAKRLNALSRIGRQLDPSAEVFPAFVSFLEQVMKASDGEDKSIEKASSAVEWLSGGIIQRKRAKELNLEEGEDEGSEIPDDEAIRAVLGIIAGLSAMAGRPLVLCVDQVDNLGADSVAALAAFLHAALDNCRHLVVVTSGVRQSMQAFKRDGVIADAAWDRLAQYRIDLLKISPDSAREMVRSRLARFHQPFEEAPQVATRLSRDPATPLGTQWLQSRFADHPEYRPRDVIRAAREKWEAEQDRIVELGEQGWLEASPTGDARRDTTSTQPTTATGRPPEDAKAAIDQYVMKKLEQAKTERILRPESLPADADNLATLCFEILRRCTGRQEYSLQSIQRSPNKPKPAFLLTAIEKTPSGETVTNGLAFCATESAMAVTWCLRRINDLEERPTHTILITDDERRPLKLAKRGAELYEQLTAAGQLQHIRLRFDDYAQLDAMNVVLGSARVGDLELDHLGVLTDQECMESLHRQGMFLKHRLLRELLTEDEARDATEIPPGVVEEDTIRDRIKNELCWRLAVTGREMTQIIIERENMTPEQSSGLHSLVKKVAADLHTEGVVSANAIDDDLYLQIVQATSA